jgi:hypothetical protein
LTQISVGNRIVRFKIPSIDRKFTVHEDLICRTSSLFKAQLQKNRKTIHEENNLEDCCVCQEDLDAKTKDITYCGTCGQNLHERCIEQWKQSSDKDKSPSCPMCRADWKNEPLLKNVSIDEQLDAEAVQMYLDWLYSGNLHIPSIISRRTDAFNLMLLKCWAVASAVDDESFERTVMFIFFKEAKAQFWDESVHWAFVEGGANEEICAFIIEVYMAHMEKGWFTKKGPKWPSDFVMALADKAMEGEKRKSYEQIKRERTRKLQRGNGMKGMDGESEVEANEPSSQTSYRTARAREYFGKLRESESLSFVPRDAENEHPSTSRPRMRGIAHSTKLRSDPPDLY